MPASTLGGGSKWRAGTRWPRENVHQGAQVVDKRVSGGLAALLRATSHWSARTPRAGPARGWSSRWRRIAVVAPKGSEPTATKGSSGRRHLVKSVQITSTAPGGGRRSRSASSRLAQRRSISTARTRAPRRASARVSTPEPAPISTTSSPGPMPAVAASCSARRGAEKCWPRAAQRRGPVDRRAAGTGGCGRHEGSLPARSVRGAVGSLPGAAVGDMARQVLGDHVVVVVGGGESAASAGQRP